MGILCEFSGRVRDAFIAKGHDCISCDLLPSESEGPHIQGDCLLQDWSGYDLLICHPPCTHLCVSGARWFKDKQKEQGEALDFVRALLNLPCRRICLENPVSIISTAIRKPNQIVQPYQFGESYAKRTCLWLKNLPPLEPTEIVDRGEYVEVGKEGRKLPRWYSNCHGKGGTTRGHERSRFPLGISRAMAEQWGNQENWKKY